MTWTVHLVYHCPGGDTDICKFITLCQSLCANWKREQELVASNPSEEEEMIGFVRVCMEFFQISFKQYGEELAKLSDDPMQFISDPVSPLKVSFKLHRIAAVKMEISDSIMQRFRVSMVDYNAFVDFKRRSETFEEYKFGNVSCLSFIKNQ